MEHDSDNRTSPERERADWLCLRIADCQRMSTKKHDMHMACMSKHGMYVKYCSACPTWLPWGFVKSLSDEVWGFRDVNMYGITRSVNHFDRQPPFLFYHLSPTLI